MSEQALYFCSMWESKHPLCVTNTCFFSYCCEMAAGLLGPIMSLLYSTIVVFFSFVPHWLSYLCVGQLSEWCLCHFSLPTCLFAHHEATSSQQRPGKNCLGSLTVMNHWQWSASPKTAGTRGASTSRHLTFQQTFLNPCFGLCYCCPCRQKWEQTGLRAQCTVSFTKSRQKNLWNRILLQPGASRRIKNGPQTPQSRILMSYNEVAH